MTTNDPPTGPFMSALKIANSSDMPEYAKTPDPAGTPSRATLLRQEGMNR